MNNLFMKIHQVLWYKSGLYSFLSTSHNKGFSIAPLKCAIPVTDLVPELVSVHLSIHMTVCASGMGDVLFLVSM